ncbi:MAG: hypothetical protein IV107_00400 [Paucibacter sp.]|nr:hypothetical protein [Roseateles sp.]
MNLARLTQSAAAFALLAGMTLGSWAADIAKAKLVATPSWQARLQLSTLEPALAGSYEAQSYSGPRLLSANLLGDYYLTGSGFGDVQGGLRATGGLMLGSLSQSSAGLALGASTGGQPWSVGQRHISLLTPLADATDPYGSMSYLGIGYTGQSLRGGWGFSADLGLVNGSATSGLRLGASKSQGMEDLLRDMRYRPVLQLGLSYSY